MCVQSFMIMHITNNNLQGKNINYNFKLPQALCCCDFLQIFLAIFTDIVSAL